MRSEPEVRATVARLVNLARDGEVDAVVCSLSLLSYADPAQRDRLRQILATLIEATASMLLRYAEPSPDNDMFAVDLCRPDGSAVQIDDLDPPVRATIRALLAAVNEHPEDTADQIALAVAGGLQATAEVVVLALRWTVNAVESCAESGVPLPDWLRSAG
jgi:hypothetical protein